MRRIWIIMVVAILSPPVSAATQESLSYTYDVHGRLTAVTRINATGPDTTTSYTYDHADNRYVRAVVVSAALAGAPPDPVPDTLTSVSDEAVEVAPEFDQPPVQLVACSHETARAAVEQASALCP